MTPRDWDLFVRGHNEANGAVEPMSLDRLQELKEQFPDDH